MSFTIIRWFNREWYFWDLSINTLFNEMTLCYVVGCNILSVELMPSNFELSFLCSSEIQFWYLITIHIYIYFLSDYLCSLVEQILEKDKNILFTWIYVYQVKLGTKIVGVNSGMNLKKKKKEKENQLLIYSCIMVFEILFTIYFDNTKIDTETIKFCWVYICNLLSCG